MFTVQKQDLLVSPGIRTSLILQGPYIFASVADMQLNIVRDFESLEICLCSGRNFRVELKRF